MCKRLQFFVASYGNGLDYTHKKKRVNRCQHVSNQHNWGLALISHNRSRFLCRNKAGASLPLPIPMRDGAVSPAVSGFDLQPPQWRLRIARPSGRFPYVDSPERLRTLVQPNGQALSPCLSTLLFTNTTGDCGPNDREASIGYLLLAIPMRVGCWFRDQGAMPKWI